jgi:uncharacterized membrane protein
VTVGSKISEGEYPGRTIARRGAGLGWAIFVFAAVGLGLSTLSLSSHYKTSPTEYCDIGENFNCDLVNRSDFSELKIAVSGAFTAKTKVPVAGIGVAGYAVLMALSRFARRRSVALVLFLGAVTGLVFALRLTYIEKYILAAWCLLCLGSLGAISIITILSGWLAVGAPRGSSQ